MEPDIHVTPRIYACQDYQTTNPGNAIRHLVDAHGVDIERAKIVVYMAELASEREASEKELRQR